MLLLLFSGCGKGPGSDPSAPVQRLIEPAAGGASTTMLARAQIAGESRYVLARRPAIPIRSRAEVTLPADGDLHVDVHLPAPLTDATELRLDAWVSVRDPAAPTATLAELREGHRLTYAAAPLIVQPQATRGPYPVVIPIADVVRGHPALLTVVGRPLAVDATERVEVGPVAVPQNARLEFAFGVEDAGWAIGWPPVRVVVRVIEEGVRTTVFERRIDPAGDPRDRRWFDESVDLAAFGGRSIRLSFESTALGNAPGATVARSFPVVSTPAIVPGRVASATRPNVVLVSLDTLRARSVSAYGAARRTTPNLDRRVAAAGALVRTAVTPVPFTPPAHMTMLTGLEPCAHGVADLHGRLPPDRLTLAERLRAAGYTTAAFTEDAYLIAGNGFDRGFDRYAENRSEESAAPGFGVETFGAAERWLEEHARPPFLLFVHTYQVHEPYTPPRGYAREFGEGTAPLDDYEREVRFTDDLLAHFLDGLEARGFAANTIVVVTSDHGEGFGEHFWTGHGFDLHDEALLVPIVIRAPGLIPAGITVEEQVGLVDLTPTVLDLVGLGAPTDVQGRSFASLLGRPGPPFEERPLVSHALPKDPLSRVPSADSVRTRTHKFIRSGTLEAVYDLAADRLEQTDVAASTPHVVSAAHTTLDAAAADCRQWSSRAAAAPSDRTTAPDWLINREETELELQRKLRSLGYVQ